MAICMEKLSVALLHTVKYVVDFVQNLYRHDSGRITWVRLLLSNIYSYTFVAPPLPSIEGEVQVPSWSPSSSFFPSKPMQSDVHMSSGQKRLPRERRCTCHVEVGRQITKCIDWADLSRFGNAPYRHVSCSYIIYLRFFPYAVFLSRSVSYGELIALSCKSMFLPSYVTY